MGGEYGKSVYVFCLIALAFAQGSPYEEAVPPAIQGYVEGYQLDAELLQTTEDSSAGDADLTGGMPCVKRQEEVSRLLEAFQAARLVRLDSPQYGVDDDTTEQLVHTWEQQYKRAEAEYDFYCTQTESDLAEISAAVKKKEVVAVKNAAQAGLLSAEATIKQKRLMAEKAQKAAQERRTKEKEAALLRRKAAREKTDKLADETIQKNTERLRRLPQISRSLMGEVRDASTGKVVKGAQVISRCLFSVHRNKSRKNGKFTLSDGVTGPTGRQCEIAVSKKGYAATKFPITVMKGSTDAEFRMCGLLPKTSDSKRFRFMLQYGAQPPNLDAHVLVPMPNDKYLDVGEHALRPDSETLKFAQNGEATSLPFTTLDHSAHRFGPETVSVHNVNDGVYHFVVSNAAQSITTPHEFHKSSARAFLYQGNKLLNTVAIDGTKGEPTQMWSVYTLSCKHGVCQLKVTDEFIAESPVK